MPEWTSDQLKVIRARNREILVSAAAGSGKTAVMVERIVTLIQEGFPLNRMLIITYTHAAAAEMKEKIRNRLYGEKQNQNCMEALEMIECSDISTIHSFCQRLIHNQFQAIGRDPDVSICDSAEKKQLFHQAFKNAVENLSVDSRDAFVYFKKAYTPQMTEKMVDQLYTFLMSLPDPFHWMKEKIENVPRETNREHPWFMTVSAMIADKIGKMELLRADMEKMFKQDDAVPEHADTLREDIKTIENYQKILSDSEPRYEEWEQNRFIRLKSVKGLTDYQKEWLEKYKKKREAIRKLFNEIAPLYFPDKDQTGRDLAGISKLLQGLYVITEATAAEYDRLKRERNTQDFHDLEHDALKILNQDAYLHMIRGEYDHIFVDECQDVSAVQDAIIQKVHGEENTLFMVGDVKQSIYRFRLADPSLFLNRMRSFSDDEEAPRRRIFLQANFRSRGEILETVNAVFKTIMRRTTAELDYENRDELRQGRVTEGFEPVCIDLIENEESETLISDIEAIADHIAARGEELLKTEYKGKNRNYTWRDMVILMRKVAGDGLLLADALTRRGIPVFFDGGKDYFDQEEVMTFRECLKLIEHPEQDISLISVLRNTPFFMKDNELGQIRLCKRGKGVRYAEAFNACCEQDSELGKKCMQIRNTIQEWRFLADTLPLSVFIWRLLRETGYYAVSGARENGEQQQANLRLMCVQAAECEKRGIHTLNGFLRYLEDMNAGGDQKSARLLGEKDDLIRIMTMHKSKGLQFPVVFCVGIDKPGDAREETTLKTHSKLGLTLRYKNADLGVEHSTIVDEVFTWQKKTDERAERIRLLYVAMTRAQEKLFMISCKTGDPLWTYPVCDARTISAGCMIDWIMPALKDLENTQQFTQFPQDSKPWKIRNFDANQQKSVEKKKVIHNVESWLESILSMDHVEHMWKKDASGENQGKLIKTSVTSLIREKDPLELPKEETDETMEDKRGTESSKQFMKLSELPEYPAFMQQSEHMTAAHRGTLIHHLLSLIDLQALKMDMSVIFNTVRDEKKRMVAQHIFTEEESRVIPESDIVRFFTSQIGQRMLNSPDIRREWNFNLVVREKDNLLLQGMIDCAFREENGWVILDYKTDRIDDEEAFVKEYREQLEWYGRAVETLTGIKVTERWLYALSTGKSYRV